MKKTILLIASFLIVGCGGSGGGGGTLPGPAPQPEVQLFPVGSATITVSSNANLALLKAPKYKGPQSLLLNRAYAQVAQGTATVTVTYNNPGVSTFSLNTANLGGIDPTPGDNELNLGTFSISALDDNSLRVCTNNSANGNRCNRIFIRVFTLGTATGGITGVAGFINRSVPSDVYGIPVFAGSVTTALGFNSNALASTVTNAATVYTQTFPMSTNRLRLSNLAGITAPIAVKADLTDAGSGTYEMNLVVQYALAYVP